MNAYETSRPKRHGFTIVELLIVIVVIAILAAISVVAYNGIQQRARASAASTGVSQAKKKLEYYKVENGSYPTSGNLAGAGVTDTDTTYQYTSSDGTIFCITGTNGTVSYTATNTTAPTQGGCAGHGQGGQSAVTNLHSNPSLEVNQNGFSVANGSVLTRQSASAIDGSSGLRVAAPAGGVTDSGVNIGLPTPVTAGQARTYIVKVRAVTAETYRLSLQNTGGTGSTIQSVSLSAGQVGTIRYTWTPTTSGPIAGYILRSVAANASTFDVDSVMVVDGTYPGNYADGNSPNWIWNGTANNSTSTGPAL